MSPSNTVMSYKGFCASVMEAQRLQGDRTFGLPPGNAISAYPSEVFKEYPGSWMRGPGVFIVPVRPNKGLWFNWTGNDCANTAVLPTVKGCNPITGLQTSGFHLERYDNKCPKHDIDFGPDRFCEKCGYKWAPQNYCCAPNTLWWDGFRAEDGSVRQFFFTEDEVRDIASKMIGKENTVPAFGFAFYRPKVERPKQATVFGSSMLYQFPHKYLDHTMLPIHKSFPDSLNTTWTYTNSSLTGGTVYGAGSKSINLSHSELTPDMADVQVYNCSSVEQPTGGLIGAMPAESGPMSLDRPRSKAKNPESILRSRSVRYSDQVKPVEAPKKEVAIGAGAKIRQDLQEDPYPLDTWKDKPDSVMTIYFVFQEEVDKMVKAGFVETTEKKEGMLSDMPVG